MGALQYFLDRLKNVIPPSPPTGGLALARLVAYAEMLGAQSPLVGVPSGSGSTLDTWGSYYSLPRITGEADAAYLARLVAYQATLGGMTTQDMQAQALEGAMALGATITHPGAPNQAIVPASYGAAGASLDQYGQIYGVPRRAAETDSAYALRIVLFITRPSTVSTILGQILDSYFGIVGTSVTDQAKASFPQFNNGLQANNGVQCLGFDAPFLSTGGVLKVVLPTGSIGTSGPLATAGSPFTAIGSGPWIALVEKALAGQKAAGIRVATLILQPNSSAALMCLAAAQATATVAFFTRPAVLMGTTAAASATATASFKTVAFPGENTKAAFNRFPWNWSIWNSFSKNGG